MYQTYDVNISTIGIKSTWLRLRAHDLNFLLGGVREGGVVTDMERWLPNTRSLFKTTLLPI